MHNKYADLPGKIRSY